MTTLEQVLAWRPGELAAVAERWRSVGRRMTGLADEVTSGFRGIPIEEFSGLNRRAAGDAIHLRAGALRRDADIMGNLADDVAAAGVDLDGKVGSLRDSVDAARTMGFIVDPASGRLTARAAGNEDLRRLLEIPIVEKLGEVLARDAELEHTVARHVPAGAQFREGTPLGIDEALAGLSAEEAEELARVMGEGELTVLQTGPGTSAVAIGDVTTASHIVTLVPGTGSSPEELALQVERMRMLHGDDIAVVLFSYDAPPDAMAAMDPAYYERAVPELRNLQTRLSENSTATMHVVGYSYGGTQVAHASTGPGLRADSVTLLGTPGVGPEIRTVGDMQLVRSDGALHDRRHNGTRVFADTSPADPIRVAQRTGVHGRNPDSREFGAGRVSGTANVYPERGLSLDVISPHTDDYWGHGNWGRMMRDRMLDTAGPGPDGRYRR